jgi:iron complex transport system ATP-binding protein
MSVSDAAAIALREVSFRYSQSNTSALDRVTVDIPAGAITALLGPNGSGKSTLLHLILGLLHPEQGSIQLMGQSLSKYGRRDMSRLLGLVPQDEYIPFDLSVLEYVLLGRAPYLDLLERPNSFDRELSFESLVAAGVASLQRRPVPSLSGGERQLVTVARALAQQPAILLLDEPTSHLDLANARRILHVLCSLRAAGKTIVLTTHDPNAAAAVADFIILLRGGRVLSSGPTDLTLTAEHLSTTYGVDIEVLQAKGRPWVLTHTLSN